MLCTGDVFPPVTHSWMERQPSQEGVVELNEVHWAPGEKKDLEVRYLQPPLLGMAVNTN